MSVLKCFLNEFYFYLTNNVEINNNLIRCHSKKLCELGDFSFSLQSVKGLKVVDCVLKKLAESEIDKDEFLRSLIRAQWSLKISKAVWLDNSTFHGFFDKPATFFAIIQGVLDKNENYGRHLLHSRYALNFELPFDGTEVEGKQLNELRMLVFCNALSNILKFRESDVECDSCEKVVKVRFVSNKVYSNDDIILLCGPVVSKKDSKKLVVTAEEFHRKRAVDMRLMAEHKYGLRLTQNWQELFQKLGEAAAIIELLQNKISQSTVVDIDDYTVSSSKGASFILYNCGRLSMLFKNFEKKVSENVYPPLTSNISDVNFALLTEPEEWQLLYVFIGQFPIVVENSIKDLFAGHVNVHHVCSFLSNMCSAFSVYYSRVRILMEPRNHLFPLLFARLYLLKALECVLHNGLNLLNIQPVKQM